jgi:hypothetical protein
MNMPRPLHLVIALFVLLLSAEIAARIFGRVDSPLYSVDAFIGYIPAPNQSGAFLNRNELATNSLSMGAGEYLPGADV